MTTTSAEIASRLRKRKKLKLRRSRVPGMNLKYTVAASGEEFDAFVEQVVRRAMEKAKKNGCYDPGKKRRSKGKGRGLARGGGRGPIGIPFGSR